MSALFLATATNDRGSQSAPACRSQTGGLFEAAGEMALMGKAAISGDLSELAPPRCQGTLCRMNLAAQHKMFWGLSNQFSEPTVKMKRAEVGFFGDFVERGIAREFLLHEFQRGEHSHQFRIAGHIA